MSVCIAVEDSVVEDSVASLDAGDVEDSVATLDTLPDDLLLQIITACYTGGDGQLALTELNAVCGLGCLCKDVLEQLQRLRPIVRFQVYSLTAAQRYADADSPTPWRVVLLYRGQLTEAVVEEAVQGRVFSIHVRSDALALAERVVPELLGAGCSLLALKLEFVRLNSTWTAAFGEAPVCSEVLTELQMDCCGLRGPLPELRLQELQRLDLSRNMLTGGLEPIMGCTALQELNIYCNHISGGLEPIAGFKALQELELCDNQLVGGLEPLVGLNALRTLNCARNHLKGGLEPLRGLRALREIELYCNQLNGDLEPLRGLHALYGLYLRNNEFRGSIEPLQGCTALLFLNVSHNQLSGSLAPLEGCKALGYRAG